MSFILLSSLVVALVDECCGRPAAALWLPQQAWPALRKSREGSAAGCERRARGRDRSAAARRARRRRRRGCAPAAARHSRSEEHTSELQSLMRISYAVFCLKKKNKNT